MIPGMDRLGAGAVDRAGCLAFCGLPYSVLRDGAHKEALIQWRSARAYPFGTGPDALTWCSERCRDLRLPPLTPASPANVSPPSPAPGQRWRGRLPGIERHGALEFDIAERLRHGSAGFTVLVPSRLDWGTGVGGNGMFIGTDDFDACQYLGPTPTPTTPSAAAPASLPMVAALGSGPPAGYVSCSRRCGRWTFENGPCWTCLGDRTGGVGQIFPDLTPSAAAPAPAPAPKPTRTPGITCRRCLLTSAGGVDHRPTCVVMRERGPGAVAAAPERQRDTFADLADEFDLLPDAGR